MYGIMRAMYRLTVLLAFLASCAMEQPIDPQQPDPGPAVPCVMADPAMLDLSGPTVEPDPVEPDPVDEIQPVKIAVTGPRTDEHPDFCSVLHVQSLGTSGTQLTVHTGDYMAGSVLSVDTDGFVLDVKCVTVRTEIIWSHITLLD